MSEKAFQKYFMSAAGHTQRIPADAQPGTPDVEVIRGLTTYRVELKVLHLGPTGNRKIKSLYKPTQPPWYINFLTKGGRGLYTCFKIIQDDHSVIYGIVEMDKEFVLRIPDIKYLEMKDMDNYKEYHILKELISDYFPETD